MVNGNIKKSMVFIDASNLSGGFKTYCLRNGYFTDINGKKSINKKISYKNLISEITQGTDFVRGYFYDAAPVPLDSKRQGFFDMLRSLEITVVTKELRHKAVTCKHCSVTDSNVPYQKGVDVSIVTDVMSLAVEKAFDVAIIVTGDNDFVDALDFVKKKGLKVQVVSFNNSLGENTMRVADKVIQLDHIFTKIII
ncbi:MAG TPA: NYN domain-containing protein [Alphaproteobacteria bacterium]|nr:NYN domain-containing protein [Alphaproteobacteria bacterium]